MNEFTEIPGYEGRYAVSTTGEVFSILTNKIMALSPDKDGYLYVGLYDATGARKRIGVHVLVLMTFVGPAPLGSPLALHDDDVKYNNNLSNLKWGNYSTNALDSVRNRTHANANKATCPKGHLYDDFNTYVWKKTPSKRGCKICRTEASIACKERKALAEIS